MIRRLHVIPIAVIGAAVLGVAGVALAVVGDDGRDVIAPVTTLGVVAGGTAPSGKPYTVSRIDAGRDSTMFCSETSMAEASAQGCQPIPDEDGQVGGRPLSPSLRLLGTDRFISVLAPKGVDGMRVTTPGSDAPDVSAHAIEVDGAGRLLLATVGGAPVTSDAPDPERVVQLLDSRGRVVQELPVPRIGGE
jgi:hypothetical protein